MRTKMNFTTNELPHIWAHQKQDEGKAGNFYFDQKTIYSYGRQFPIASHLDDKTVAFTTRSYSNTTAKHINLTKGAISHKAILYCYDPDGALRGFHTHNIESFIYKINSELSKITTRTKKPELMQNAALHQFNMLQKYLAYFKIKPSKEVKQVERLLNNPQFIEAAKSTAKKREEAEKRAAAKRQKMIDAKVKDWKLYGKTETVGDHTTTYLRTNGEIVETSKGIKISIQRAKLYYNWVMTTGICNSCNYSMKQYQVNELTATHLIVGCHKIPMTEIKYIAKKLKF